ncbi:MAG: HD domain-containing protein [Candidatus Absconditabacterales bacterium]
MLHFDHLEILDTHTTFLTKKIKTQKALFLVGGCIRDLLLGTENHPTDIDFTMAGKPDAIYTSLDKKGLSHFITEKFGTITLIQKNLKKVGKSGKNNADCLSDSSANSSDSSVIKYELTPLRTEGAYEDFRHPGEITRSNDILLDSMRRDFTVNCIYYYSTKIPKGGKVETWKCGKVVNDDELAFTLTKNGFVYITNENIFILQSHELINKLFADGIFQKDELPYLTNQLTEHTVVSTNKHKASSLKHQALRFIIDPSNGVQDLIKRKLRAVGDPDKRFTEDALRMIRAIRFVSVMNEKLKNGDHQGVSANLPAKAGKVKQSGLLRMTRNDKTSGRTTEPVILFDFIKETWVSIKKNSPLVAKVAKERIKDELIKSFVEGNPFAFISLLDEAKLLDILFPALAKTKNVDQPVRFHPFDVYTHTMLALFELQKINKDYLVRLSMLYHDVGKVDQFELYKQNLSKEELREIMAGPLNHRKSGATFVREDFAKLGFGKKEIDEISRLVSHHHKLEEIIYALPEKREKNMRKFLSEAGVERVNNIIDITIADRLGQYNPLQNSSDITEIYELRKLLERLHKKEGQFTMKQLAVSGDDVMKKFKLKAGPQVGVLLEKAMERVIDDIKGKNTKEKIFCYLAPKVK